MADECQPSPSVLELMEPLSSNPSEIDHTTFSYLLRLQNGCVFVFIRDILKIVANPEVERAGVLGLLVMRSPSGEMSPAYLPNIGDMYGRENVSLLRLRLANIVNECPKVHRLPPGLHHFFTQINDPMPIVKTTLPIYSLKNAEQKVKIGAFTDGLCVYGVDASMSTIGIDVAVERDEVDPFKRCHKIKLAPVRDPRFPDIPMGGRIAIWNCRGLSRPSFEDNLSKLREAYDPCVVVVTEARVSTLNFMRIWHDKGFDFNWKFYDSQCLDGGVAVLWLKSRASVDVHCAPNAGVGNVCVVGDIRV